VTAPIDLVIFDCDGVLLDSERLAVRVERRLLAELGWEITEAEIVERFVGRSDAAMRAEVEAHLGRPLPSDWDARARAAYRAVFEAELEPVDGIRDALELIRLPTCVASSSDHDKLEHSLRLVGLYERFRGRIFSATEVAHGKPAPDLFLHAARTLGTPPERCVVIEDSRYGVQAARAAGMRSLGYAGGLTPAAALAGPGTVVFHDMRALPELIAAIGSGRRDADGPEHARDGADDRGLVLGGDRVQSE
jgi:HAD superfamily hydrolase (TIGR01509 family)